MYPSQHIILGAIFSVSLFLIFPGVGFLGALIIFLSSVLIDVDHYFYYVYKKKDWSLIRAYWWFMIKSRPLLSLTRKEREKVYEAFVFLHGVEVLGILLLLGIFLSKYFLFICIGFIFHISLDIIYERKYRDRIDKISLIYDYLKFKKLKLIEGLKNKND